jgi:hypothetical protein
MLKSTQRKDMWRKGIFLSATFLVLLSLSGGMVSCKKKLKPAGEGALSEDALLSSEGIDTFALRTYSIPRDSVSTRDPRFNLLGSYHDPVFGTVEANFYTQISLSGVSPNFGDFNEITIDSFVVSFRFGGYYGNMTHQLFEVYELDDNLYKDSSYYSFSTAAVKPDNLVPTANNEGYIRPNPLANTIVGTDSAAPPQLRIPLDTVFARDLMQLAAASATNDVFIEQFKGLHFRVNNGMQAPGQGGVVYLESINPASKLTVYYKQDTIPREFDFLIGAALADFNHVDIDNTGTRVGTVLQDTISGQQEFYAQVFGSRAKIEFPTIENLPKNIVIHQARLELPVSYFVGSDLYPSTTVTASARLQEGSSQLFFITSGNPTFQYNAALRAYTIDMRNYIQSFINGQVINDGIIIDPFNFNSTVERIIFNGPNTTNKLKPRLRVLYTEF